MVQLEFEFAQVYIEKGRLQKERFNKILFTLAQMRPDRDILKLEDVNEDLCFPISVILDPRDQFVFPLIKELDKTGGWKGWKIDYAT